MVLWKYNYESFLLGKEVYSLSNLKTPHVLSKVILGMVLLFLIKKASYYCFNVAGAGVDGGEGAAKETIIIICESTITRMKGE